LYSDEHASLWVAKLGQPSKEGEVVDVVVWWTRSAPIHCHTPSDGGVTVDAAHGWTSPVGYGGRPWAAPRSQRGGRRCQFAPR
jgi:hypothetical protein